MIHLRLVAPSESSMQVVEFLEAAPSVINLISLPGAAHKPDGDVILCDVAREDASRVLTELRRLQLHHEGSIAVEYVDTAISDAARAAEQAAPGRVGDAVVWESVRARTLEESELHFAYVAFMALASIITAIGILTDSVILLIGGMLVSPEFGPLAGTSVALVERRWQLARKSAVALLTGFPLGIAAALVLTVLLEWTGVAPEVLPPNREATLFISHPDWYSVLVALAAGMAGTLSLTTVKSSALIGVLVSATTMPAAANISVSLAYTEWADLRGSVLQLLVNLVALVVGGVLTLLVQRWAYRRGVVPKAG